MGSGTGSPLIPPGRQRTDNGCPTTADGSQKGNPPHLEHPRKLINIELDIRHLTSVICRPHPLGIRDEHEQTHSAYYLQQPEHAAVLNHQLRDPSKLPPLSRPQPI